MIFEAFNKEIFDFIKANESSDPFELSLRSKHFSNETRRLISKQIQSRRKLRKKIPEWLNFEHLILPDPVSIEQASSGIIARYKANLISGGTLMDLTGGLGVDAYYFAKRADKVIYVEKNPDISSVAAYNFSLMGMKNIEVICGLAEEIVEAWNTPLDYIFLDPSRRVQSRKVYRIEDSEPNILEIQDKLIFKSKVFLLKTSPFLDLKSLLQSIKNIAKIHVLAIDNECKEILSVSDRKRRSDDVQLITRNFTGDRIQEYQSTLKKEHESDCIHEMSGRFVYDPNAAIRKAGLFRALCADFNLYKPAPNSHIYFSDKMIADFPGRAFELIEILPFHKFIKHNIYRQANIAVRNFPISVKTIREKAKIKEGGEIFIFGTTNHSGQNYFVICQKVSQDLINSR